MFAEGQDVQASPGEAEALDRFKKRLDETDKSPVCEMFYTLWGKQLRCANCGYQHGGIKPPEMLWPVSLIKESPAHGFHASVADALAAHLGEETTDAANAVDCANCQKRERVAVWTELWSLPEVLIIHLKRFHFEETAG